MITKFIIFQLLVDGCWVTISLQNSEIQGKCIPAPLCPFLVACFKLSPMILVSIELLEELVQLSVHALVDSCGE
jgi:hypothetical protein